MAFVRGGSVTARYGVAEGEACALAGVGDTSGITVIVSRLSLLQAVKDVTSAAIAKRDENILFMR
jgi:hypothetical protein